MPERSRIVQRHLKSMSLCDWNSLVYFPWILSWLSTFFNPLPPSLSLPTRIFSLNSSFSHTLVYPPSSFSFPLPQPFPCSCSSSQRVCGCLEELRGNRGVSRVLDGGVRRQYKLLGLSGDSEKLYDILCSEGLRKVKRSGSPQNQNGKQKYFINRYLIFTTLFIDEWNLKEK